MSLPTAIHNQRVAVLLGGDSAEREVSLKSGQAVLNALLNANVNAIAVDPAEQPLSELLSLNVETVLIMLHGRGGEDGSLQGALEHLGIPYTGSGVLGSALAMDKIRSKQIWQSLQLPTASYQIVEKSRYEAGSAEDIMAELGDTIMVKPAREGSSIGMAKTSSANQLETAISNAFQYDNRVLLERYIQGDEYTVSILGGDVLPSICMRTPRAFYDYQAKYQTDTTEYSCPSGLSASDESHLGQLAAQAFDALGCEGWGRVDFMRDQQGQFYLLEANTVPGMTEKSLVPMAANANGLSFEDLCLRILATADKSVGELA